MYHYIIVQENNLNNLNLNLSLQIGQLNYPQNAPLVFTHLQKSAFLSAYIAHIWQISVFYSSLNLSDDTEI